MQNDAENPVFLQAEHTWPRRDSIILADNPRPKLDYVVSTDFKFEGVTIGNTGPNGVHTHMRYVPDKYVIASMANLENYKAHLSQRPWPTLADLATAIMADLNDVVMPRWIEMRLGIVEEGTIYLQERQPRWENPNLLARLSAWE